MIMNTNNAPVILGRVILINMTNIEKRQQVDKIIAEILKLLPETEDFEILEIIGRVNSYLINYSVDLTTVMNEEFEDIRKKQ